MAYIGVQPADAYTSFAVQHFTTSATTSYTLDNPVANENEIALFINNVRQEPGSSYAYTASGTSLTLSAATSASDTMYCVFIGKAVQTVTPATGSVTNDMLAGSIANAKLANSSITLNGSAVSLGGSATTPKGVDVGELWSIQNGSTTTSSTSGVFTSPVFYRGITGSAQMTQSSGVFTFPSTGYYLVTFLMNVYDNGEDHRQFVGYIRLSTNGGVDYATRSQGSGFIEHTSQGSNTHASCYTQVVLDIENTSTHKLRFEWFFSNTSLTLYSDQRDISAYFQKLGET